MFRPLPRSTADNDNYEPHLDQQIEIFFFPDGLLQQFVLRLHFAGDQYALGYRTKKKKQPLVSMVAAPITPDRQLLLTDGVFNLLAHIVVNFCQRFRHGMNKMGCGRLQM